MGIGNRNIENVMLVELAIFKPAKSTQTSVWMAQHTHYRIKVGKTSAFVLCTCLGDRQQKRHQNKNIRIVNAEFRFSSH